MCLKEWGSSKVFMWQIFTVGKGETRCLIDARLVLSGAQAVRVIGMLTCSSKTCFVDQHDNPSILWASPHLEHFELLGPSRGNPDAGGIPNGYFLVNHQIRV
jgi:hypothetical protein